MPDDNARAALCADIAHAQLMRASHALTDRIERLEALGRDEEVTQTVLAKNCVIKAMQALKKAGS